MKLLIGNDLDDAIVRKRDIRAWAQRILWFAEDGDIVVLMAAADEAFLRYVTGLTGTDPGTLTIHVLPPGRFGGRSFDPHTLLDESLLDRIRPDLVGVEQVLALWPSPAVAEFVSGLGIAHLWPGASFYSQNGAEVLNSMGNFRAFAKAAGVPVSEGSVCRTLEDARVATERLLETADAVMVKKAHGGAGAGNQIVSRDPHLATGHAGGLYVHTLGAGEDAVGSFWRDQWNWASAEGRYPVAVERFVPNARSVYVEFFLDEQGVCLRELGELVFEDGQLHRETVPLRTLSQPLRGSLIDAAHRLATYYHQLGHRGFLSTDAVVTPDNFTFTEVNAQVTGSTHLYSVVAHHIVDVWRAPWRTVSQCTSPAGWMPVDLDGFLEACDEAGCRYDPVDRKGVVAVTPHVGGDDRGPIIFAVAYETPLEFAATIERLAAVLARDRHAVG